MIMEIQNKPLCAGLIAMVMAIALALGSIGTALGTPDSSKALQITTETWNNTGIEDLAIEVDGTYVWFDTVEGGWLDDNFTCNVFLNGVLQTTIASAPQFHPIKFASYDFSDIGLHLGDELKIVGHFDSVSVNDFGVIIKATDSTVGETPTNVAFALNFKATGIQATGFANYKEAFAALNGTNQVSPSCLGP